MLLKCPFKAGDIIRNSPMHGGSDDNPHRWMVLEDLARVEYLHSNNVKSGNMFNIIDWSVFDTEKVERITPPPPIDSFM
jgi:hypothetical protein